MTLSKVLLLVAVVILAITAFAAFFNNTVSIPHLLAGLALGGAVFAAAGLVP